MICKLCQKEKPLLNSHIIPEFCYRAIYDEKHRIHELTTEPDVPNMNFRQKGLRERLLCRECEQLISYSEKYVREVIYGGTEITLTQEPGCLILNDLDYTLFKHFQLSILWRCGITSHDYFSKVNLGAHEHRLRKMVLSKDVGKPYEYGCLLFALVTSTFRQDNKVEPVDGMIISPEEHKVLGHEGYRMTFGGLTWIFIVSERSEEFPYREFFLSEGGRLVLPLVKAEDSDYITGFSRMLKEAGKLHPIDHKNS